MLINIVMEIEKQEDVYDIAENIHKSLVGNNDYIDSNIILNFNNQVTPKTITLFADVDSCQDKDYISQKVKYAIDLVIGTMTSSKGEKNETITKNIL